MPSKVIANVVSASDKLPDFDSSGHLPVGIHTATFPSLSKIVRHNEHRRKMWQQLACFLIDPVVKHKFCAVYVGGGFVSNKPQPTDIDLVLETSSPYGPEAFEAVAPFFVTGLDKIEMIYSVHLQFWMRGAPSGLTDYRVFFQYDRPGSYTHVLNRSRGIVHIDLTEAGTLHLLRRYIRGENTSPVNLAAPLSHRTPADEMEHLQGIKRTLAMMGVNASKPIVISDAEGRIAWVNDCFQQTRGFTLEEARGKRAGQLLQGPATNPTTAGLLRRAVEEGRECACRQINYRKDGSPYVADIILSPLFEGGRLTGFLAVEEDLGSPENSDLLRNARQAAA